MRLQKFMAHAGVDSRRNCEEIIAAGRVSVNGTIVDTQGHQVEPGDIVRVDGKRIFLPSAHTYVLLNKPRGVVSTVKDNKGRKTVLDIVEGFGNARLYPVGRLDMDSSGLLLLTDDGTLTQRLLHPKYGIKKTYLVTVRGKIDEKTAHTLSAGVTLSDGPTAPAEFVILEDRGEKTRLKVTISEGRNRQIRRMFEAVGAEVVTLERTEFGPLRLGRLGKGEYRPLKRHEVEKLKAWR
ncbi:pseudouridine synthase [Peptoniphilus ivorii]|uniref:pseudouridine synthase n=1 Tax=Aedoeadaptatus ivorii TaxID=54006 RepID=UPI0027845CA8|nr:pseudouridine synthase [Peptoniphilus ivorii]MDQ0507760.1 pseudouridine synthase [Peptoniphilus ivorii]